MHRLAPPLLFVFAVLLRSAFVAWVGQPYPKGLQADENVYLELAWNLWTHGEYGSRVSVSYPPLYPMFVAPLFALQGNALRFALLYAGQALVSGLATLLLLPMLRSVVSKDRAWGILTLVQLLAGVSYSARTAQSETLFGALFVATLGATWLCWEKLSLRRAILAGLFAGLAIATRRTALVLPVAFALLLVQDLWEGRRASLVAVLRRGVGFGIGLGIGFLPEILASALHGGVIQPYSENVAARHLSAGTSAFASIGHLGLAAQVSARQVAYVVLATFGAPLVLAALLFDSQSRKLDRPPALARMGAFALWSALGLCAMTSLHILRYSFSVRAAKRWDVYPRYLDPAELPLILAAVGLAAWAWREGGLGTWDRPRLRRLLLPWISGAAVLALISGPMLRPRGGRLGWVEGLKTSSFAPIAPWVFPAACLLALGLQWSVLWPRGAYAKPWGLVASVALSWLVCLHVPVAWLRVGLLPAPLPAILRNKIVAADPLKELGIVVPRPSNFARSYYEPAFRTDHPVWFLRPTEAELWAIQHGDALVLTQKGDPSPTGLPLAKVGEWRVWAARDWAPP